MSQTNEHPCQNYTMLPIKGFGLAVDTSALGNIAPSGDWEQQLEETGWVKFPNGLIMQWGCYLGSEKGNIPIPFGKVFERPPFTALATFLNAEGYADIGVIELNVDRMTVYVDTNKVGATGFRWLVLGA